MRKSKQVTRLSLASLVLVGSLGISMGPSWAAIPSATNELTVTPVGSFSGGGEAAAEIVGFDAETNRAFVTNGLAGAIDIIDFSDQESPSLLARIDITPYGDDITSVAVKGGIVAAALTNAPSGSNAIASIAPVNGSVILLDTSGIVLNQLPTGVLPDSLTFSRDGKTIVVAGEGEPNCDPDNDDPNLAQDPLGTVSIIDLSNGALGATVTTLDFSSFGKDALLAENVRIFFPGSTAAQDLEPEFATISSDGTRAYVTLQENNAIAVVDLLNRQIIDVVSLGYKDHSLPDNGLDASDRDDGNGGPATNIAQWPLLGMFQPDAISAFMTPSGEFLATANEGDARDYSCYSEEKRISGLNFAGSAVDSSLLTNLTLGRLNSTTAFPTASPITSMYSFGARSFSIWSTNGALVWDSGDQLEQFIAATYPTLHNAQNADPSSYDGRSDNKGPEPEGLVVGNVGGRSIAFVGLERAGGIAVYDVTSPSAPTFNSYINPLINGSGPGSTDSGPEGLTFVSGCETSDGIPLVLVANEISGTTTMYRVTGGAPDVCTTVVPSILAVVAPAFTG
jgi:hypothetical protein